MDSKPSTSSGKSTSKVLLSVNGDGSSRAVVESLFRKRPEAPTGDRPKTFKIARSPLLDQLQSFLPQFEKSTQQLLAKSQEELEELSIENTNANDKVIEMNIVLGEMEDDDNSDSSDDNEDSDSDNPILGPITEQNLKIPSEATGGKRNAKNLIKVVSDASEEESEGARSDGELTVASSSSGER